MPGAGRDRDQSPATPPCRSPRRWPRPAAPTPPRACPSIARRRPQVQGRAKSRPLARVEFLAHGGEPADGLGRPSQRGQPSRRRAERPAADDPPPEVPGPGGSPAPRRRPVEHAGPLHGRRPHLPVRPGEGSLAGRADLAGRDRAGLAEAGRDGHGGGMRAARQRERKPSMPSPEIEGASGPPSVRGRSTSPPEHSRVGATGPFRTRIPIQSVSLQRRADPLSNPDRRYPGADSAALDRPAPSPARSPEDERSSPDSGLRTHAG